MSGADAGPALVAFERALAREAHNLSSRPDLLWQQLYNRLQWEDAPIPDLLAPELTRRRTPGSPPWLRTNHGLPESPALIRTMAGHDGSVSSCAIGGENNAVVSGGEDGTVRIWDAERGLELATLRGHSGSVTDCAISPDGLVAVSTGSDGTLRVWDVAAHAERIILAEGEGELSCCAISPDARLVVSGSAGGALKVWEVAGGAERKSFRVDQAITGCAISPDGATILWAGPTSGDRGSGEALSAGSAAPLHELEGTCFAVSRDGRFAVTAHEKGATVSVRDLASGAVRLTLKGHRGSGTEKVWSHAKGVNGCAISPDGGFVVSASKDNTLKVWDPTKGEEITTLRGHTSAVTDCAVSADGTLVASASSDGTVKLWASARFDQNKPLFGHPDTVLGCGIGGEFLVSRGWDMSLKIWDATTGEARAHIDLGPTQGFDGCAVSPDGSFATAQSHGPRGPYALKVFDVAGGRERFTLLGHRDWITDCAISPDGAFIVTASGDGTLKIWDPSTGAERAELGGDQGLIRRCAISRDCSRVVSMTDWGELRVWDLSSGQLDGALTAPGVTTDFAISPDGSFVAAVVASGTLTIWDTAGGDQRGRLEAHRRPRLVHCEISPDARFIVTASKDLERAIKVWDALTLELWAAFEGEANAIAISPDSALVVATCEDKTMRVWDVAGGRERAAIALAGPLTCLELHDSWPRVLLGDAGGNLYLIDLVGIEYGSVTTAGRLGGPSTS